MLVRDARQQLLRQLFGRLDQRRRERGNRARQSCLLASLRLIAPIEDAIKQLRGGIEHVTVEALCDLPDVLPDSGQSGFDDLARPVRQHRDPSRSFSTVASPQATRALSTTVCSVENSPRAGPKHFL